MSRNTDNQNDLDLAEEYLKAQEAQGKPPQNITIVRPELILAQLFKHIERLGFDLHALNSTYISDIFEKDAINKTISEFRQSVMKYQISSSEDLEKAYLKCHEELHLIERQILSICRQATKGSDSTDVQFVVRPDLLIPKIEEIIDHIEGQLAHIERILNNRSSSTKYQYEYTARLYEISSPESLEAVREAKLTQISELRGYISALTQKVMGL